MTSFCLITGYSNLLRGPLFLDSLLFADAVLQNKAAPVLMLHCSLRILLNGTCKRTVSALQWNDLASTICFNESYKIDVYGTIMHDAYSA